MSEAGAAIDTSPDARVQARALAQVAQNQATAPWLLMPFALVAGLITRDNITPTRQIVWIGLALTASVVVLSANRRYRAHTSQVDRSTTWLLRAGQATVGAAIAFPAWAAASSATDVVMLFTLFVVTGITIGTVSCIGRTDMFVAYLVPSVAVAVTGQLASDVNRALIALWVFLVAALVMIFRSLTGTAHDAIRLQLQSDELVGQLASERLELTDTIELLGETNRQLAYQASHDSLTGLLNRRGTMDQLEEMLRGATVNAPVGVLFCDLDRFKVVNDTLGHRGGDEFLKVIADRIVRSLEPGGIVGRMGGDEFVIAISAGSEEAATAIAHRLGRLIAQPVHAGGREFPSAASIGVALYPHHAASAGEVVRHANDAMFKAKSLGRNRVGVFDQDMEVAYRTRLSSETVLRRAIDDGEIVSFFQPELDATTGAVIGAELLARWVQPNGTIAAAHEFVDIAAKAGLLDRLTERVTHGARQQMRRLAMLGLPADFRFRINLSPDATGRAWRDNPIDQLIQGLDPAILTVDVREALIGDDIPAAAANLAAFRADGGRVCLDDFAEGALSLGMLRRLPLDEVRIDRLSIDTIASHPHDRAIVRSIISLVRELGLSVTADGVENGAQADALIALGCVRQQGHLYAPALPAADFENFLLHRMAEHLTRPAEPNWNTDQL